VKVRRYALMLTITMVIVIGTFAATLAAGSSPLLGLDLQGGLSVTLTAPKGAASGQIAEAVSIMRNRVDSLGVAEPDISQQGNQVIVELPGVKDRNKALNLIGQTAELRFRPVLAIVAPESATLTTTTTTAKGGTTTTKPGTTTTKAGTTTTTAATSTTKKAALGGQVISPQLLAARVATTTAATTTSTAATTTTTAGGTTSTLSAAQQAQLAASATSIAGVQPPGQGCPVYNLATNPLPKTTPEAQDRPECWVVLPVISSGTAMTPKQKQNATRLLLGPSIVNGSSFDGKDVSGANANLPSNSASWQVDLNFKSSGLTKFNAMDAQQYRRPNASTTPALSNQVAFVLDGVVQSYPQFSVASFSGAVSITGTFTNTQAGDLARVLQYGALPVKFNQGQVENVSPSLGKDQLSAGILAGIIGLSLVALYVLVFYRILGLVIWLGIATSAMATFTLVSYLGGSVGLTLTLSGVVGLIVSVGVTVDSYVVYFERLKDEVRSGKTVRSSVERGFKLAFRTIIAADTVTLISALALYAFAIGSVRGFAFYLGLSTFLDIAVAYFVMHPLVVLLARRSSLVKLPKLGLAAGLDAPGVEV
jgi:preprotein translocase subunit SecD